MAAESTRPTRRVKDASATRTKRPARPSAREQSSSPAPRSVELAVDVVWGDITKVNADVLMCGHYVGVLPQRGELYLDRLVSGWTPKAERELVISELTRRGALHGDVGELYFFPRPGGGLVAIVGMGQLGTFRPSQARALGRTVAQVVGLLPEHKSLATLLVGSGEGNLEISEAVRSFGDGIVEALVANDHLSLERLTIVERKLDRALEVHDAVRSWAKAHAETGGDKQSVRIACAPRLTDGLDGRVSKRFGCSMLLAAIAKASGSDLGSRMPEFVEGLLETLPESARDGARSYLQGTEHSSAERTSLDLRELAMQFRLQAERVAKVDKSVPSRIAFTRTGDDIRVAAITNTTTAAEQLLRRRAPTLIEASRRLQDPDPKEWVTHAREVERLVVPRDFRPILAGLEPLIIEVDRLIAQVPWELLPGDSNGTALSLRRSVSRQLRTRYSPQPFAKAPDRRYRALVIGDPADDEHRLKEARDEAKHVAAVLTSREITCDLLIGPPEDGTGAGPEKGIRAADYGRVISLLQSGEYDIVHFSGHAFFDATAPEMSGWLFKGGVLTASELIGMERPPLLVVANACESARLALPNEGAADESRGRGNATSRLRAESDEGTLVAGLADEFFKQGVIDYIGTAWPVPSEPAKVFAEGLYSGLFASGNDRKSIGDAILHARLACRQKAPLDSIVWGAYQHYGDPTRMFPEPSLRVGG